MWNLLQGARVLDLTRLLPGGYATMLLADLGAEVIKIEAPGVGDWTREPSPIFGGTNALFAQINRNKKSLVLNLKSDAGREVLLRLAERSEALVEGFRPGVAARRACWGSRPATSRGYRRCHFPTWPALSLPRSPWLPG